MTEDPCEAVLIVNLTPHPIKLKAGDNELPVDPNGDIAMVQENLTPVGRVGDITIVQVTYGKTLGLPEPQQNTIYIVSPQVAAAVALSTERDDVYMAALPIRDAEGRVIGAGALACI